MKWNEILWFETRCVSGFGYCYVFIWHKCCLFLVLKIGVQQSDKTVWINQTILAVLLILSIFPRFFRATGWLCRVCTAASYAPARSWFSHTWETFQKRSVCSLAALSVITTYNKIFSIHIQLTSRYGQFHIMWVSIQTLDNHIKETRFVEYRQCMTAALTGSTTQCERHMKDK